MSPVNLSPSLVPRVRQRPGERPRHLVRLWDYVPLLCWVAFSGLTIFCYACGPVIYPHVHSELLYAYLFAVHLAVVLGYQFGIRQYSLRLKSDKFEATPHFVGRLGQIIRWLSVAALIAVVLWSISRGGSPTLSAAIDDPTSARRTWMAESGTSVFQYIAVFLTVSHLPLVALTLSYWSLIRPLWRIPAIVVLAFYAIFSIQGGSRAGIYGFLVIALTGAAVGIRARRLPLRMKTLFLVAAGSVVSFALYASFIVVHRNNSGIADYSEFLRRQNEFPVDHYNFAFDLFPKSVEPAILSGFQYFGHSYEGLAICLEKPFIGIGFGTGHSAVLNRNLVRITGDEDLARLTYFERLVIEDGYSESLWITMYPWIASDLTFPGSIVYMFFMAWMVATAWRESIRGENIYSVCVFAWQCFTISALSMHFSPGDYGALIGFWGSMILWLRERSRLRRRRSLPIALSLGSHRLEATR